MDFRLTDEQEMLRDTVAALFADHCSSSDLRRMLDEGAPRDPARWRAIVDMGLPGLMVPEAMGGTGLGPVEMALVAIAAGHALLPEPLVEHAGVAMPLLADAGVALDDLAPDVTIAVGAPRQSLVADADGASALILAHATGTYFVLRADTTLSRVESIDPFRRLFRVEWEPNPGARIGDASLWDAAYERGALFAAAQLLGLAQRAVDLSVAYAAERQQFGKPIGSFQAIKHHLATAQMKIEFARPVVLAAADLLARGSALAPTRISHAKLAAHAAADLAAHAAVQVHGAMGYSWEVDVHFVLKRVLALGAAWGSPAAHRSRVAAHVLASPLGADRTFGDPFAREAVLEPA
jgi:alkylation response protein AidB-like acyl-CoA dehydrogenase